MSNPPDSGPGTAAALALELARAAALGLACASAALAAPQAPALAHTAVAEAHGLTLRYPEGWVEKRPRGNPLAVLKVSSNAPDAANCYLEVAPGAADPDLLETLRARHPDLRLLAQGRLTVAGAEAQYAEVAFRFQSLGEAHAVRNLVVRWRRGEQRRTLTCGAWDARYEEQRPTFWAIVESVRER